MLVGVSDSPPHEEDRDRKHQRLSHDPSKTEAFAAEARVDLTNNQGADDPPLDEEPSPKRRHPSGLPPERRLGRRVFAGADHQQPDNAVGEQTARKNHAEGDNPFGIERVIGEVRLRDGFEIKLLALRFEARGFK